MPASILPPDEIARLAALRALDIVDSPDAEVFDAFTRVFAGVLRSPMSAMTFIESDRLWLKAATGIERRYFPRAETFCADAILTPHDVMCVLDAARDIRFIDNPLVTGESAVRFYAGAPILTEGGMPIGALCVLDQTPHFPTGAELRQLRDLATGVSAAAHLHGLVKRLERDARSDPLTGLGNRREFERALTRLAPDGVAFYLLDLDNFKGINDLFGHRGGDLALRETARRLNLDAGSCWQVFRLGGEKFALVVPGMRSRAERVGVADRVHRLLGATFVIDGQAVPLRTSIGIVAYAGNAAAVEMLIHQADVALYQAKHAGGGTSRHVQDAIQQSGTTGVKRPPASLPGPVGRLGLEDRLRQALVPPGTEPFTLSFQSVIALDTGQPASLEALIRWQTGAGTFIPPSEFVVLAERLGLIGHLDRWVLDAACRTAVSWPEAWPVSINGSAASFGLLDVPRLVRDALDASGLAPGRLIVEMTETALSVESQRARRAVGSLRAAGVGVALDDFGAGHGSLKTLRQFPFSELNLDRSLIQGIATDKTQAHMVELVIKLGRTLGLHVVIEGVEIADELRAVARSGATLIQGHLLARPLEPAEVARTVTLASRRMREALRDESMVPALTSS